MNDRPQFPYDLAFDRNLGLATDFEQLALACKRVAIAGMGGVGGVHLLTLARLGIGAFTIADFDQFEFANFNRQIGATVSTVGRDKCAVLEQMALAINPDLRIRRFDHGVTSDAVDDFLRDADLFVDGFDFFELSLRRSVFVRCAELGIPAVTAAPLGMGVAFVAFQPKGMSFDRYFRLDGQPAQEQYLRFLVGLSPRLMAARYLVDPTRVDIERHRGPSSIAACQLCAGVTAVAAFQLLLARDGLKAAPYNYQFDPYAGRFHVTRLLFGNAGPLQQLKLAVARRRYGQLSSVPPRPEPSAQPRTTLEEILNLARWAPAGDNSQPWKFRIEDPETVHVTIRHDPGNIYEYRDGEPTWLAAGMLLETMRIAATIWQRDMTWEIASDSSVDITVRFRRAEGVRTNPLASFISLRSVDRRRYRRRRLTAAEKATLAACFADNLILDWHESWQSRWHIAWMSARATGIRLRCPEAFSVHQRIIDWDHAFSETGIPAAAVGVSSMTLPLMRWALKSWNRARLLNRLDGTMASGLQMDVLPGLGCAAWFVVRKSPGVTPEVGRTAELLDAGQNIQRFWLTAQRLGLAMQPSLATIGFAHYGERQAHFSTADGVGERARRLARRFLVVPGVPTDEVLFMGRIGEPYSRLPTSRSIRRPLHELVD